MFKHQLQPQHQISVLTLQKKHTWRHGLDPRKPCFKQCDKIPAELLGNPFCDDDMCLEKRQKYNKNLVARTQKMQTEPFIAFFRFPGSPRQNLDSANPKPALNIFVPLGIPKLRIPKLNCQNRNQVTQVQPSKIQYPRSIEPTDRTSKLDRPKSCWKPSRSHGVIRPCRLLRDDTTPFARGNSEGLIARVYLDTCGRIYKVGNLHELQLY